MNQDYQEINLLDYIKVIIKRWKIIVVMPIILIMITACYVIAMTPKVYEAKGLIKIGQVSGSLIESIDQTLIPILTEKNAKQILEQILPEELKSKTQITKTQAQSLLSRIEINNGSKQKIIEMPENFLRVSYQDANPEVAQRVVGILQNSILESHQNQYDLQIKTRDDNLAQREEILKEVQANLEASEKLVKNLETTLIRYPTNYSQGSGISLSGELTARDNLRTQVANLESEVLNSKLAQRYDKMSEIISSPLLPDTPTKYQKFSITLVIALILGLFLGILIAFGLEWWENNSAKLKS